MKTRTWMFSAVVAAGLVLAAQAGRADYEAVGGIVISDVREFQEPLAAYGNWIVVAPYGLCWTPSFVPRDWRPYVDGYWTWTDAGWFWVSQEPWAWATYHYGRWAWDAYNGWVWVPDVQWAPAWVYWRSGGGYYGWAPLPPQGVWAANGVITTETIVLAPSAFVYVEAPQFCNPIQPTTVIVNNYSMVYQTVNCTNIRFVNNCVVNYGPSYATVQRVTGQHFRSADAKAIWNEQSQRVIARSEQERVIAPPVAKARPERGTTPPPAVATPPTVASSSHHERVVLPPRTYFETAHVQRPAPAVTVAATPEPVTASRSQQWRREIPQKQVQMPVVVERPSVVTRPETRYVSGPAVYQVTSPANPKPIEVSVPITTDDRRRLRHGPGE